MASPSRFTGWPAEAFDFYDRLAADNSRAWWAAHKDEYERWVREPMAALLAELAAEFGEGRIYRPYRDVRFSADKSPIKDHQGAVVMLEDSVGYYVQVSAAGLFVAGGWYAPAGQQLSRFRAAVAGGQAGHLRVLLSEVAAAGFDIDGRPLKTRPRGVPADHPDLDLLRYRALTVGRTWPPGLELADRRALTLVRDGWRSIAPLLEWLADTVGPAVDPALDPAHDPR
jgi:uncharacterized protein (TIGR02453 family)